MKPRLHVLLARDAKTAVVLRRGPSRSVAAIGWDRKRDRFDVGQWHDFSNMTFEPIEAPYARTKSMKPRSGAVSTRRTRT